MKNNLSYQVSIHHQQLALKSVFRIARGTKTQADVIVITLTDGQYIGWAESVPYARYGESIESVTKQIQQLKLLPLDNSNIDKEIASLPAGAARNALDCALWDLRAKQKHTEVAELLSLAESQPCVTAQTLSIDTPENMAKAVLEMNNPPLVKVKLDNQSIIEKMTAIQQAAPQSKFIVDANEGWSLTDLQSCCAQLAQLNVVLIEQPLPADSDNELIHYQSPVPLCADESCHTRKDLGYLQGRYQVVNIKLDKTGGLTEAQALLIEAKDKGFEIMLGCMVGSSLAMAPASLLVNDAKFVDLDGPLLIEKDKAFGLDFHQGVMQPVKASLWGSATDMNYSEARSLMNS